MYSGSTGLLEAVAVTILPLGFLIIIFCGGVRFRYKNIEQDGKAPINRVLFYTSKYSIVALWGSMALQSWGVCISFIEVPGLLQLVALLLWAFGFLLLYLGRLKMGDSFRLGIPREDTCLKADGLFRLSRNPMYVGMYATIVASALYSLNPIVILLGGFVIAVHHSIVLAEEAYMQKTVGREYTEYCYRVRRYV